MPYNSKGRKEAVKRELVDERERVDNFEQRGLVSPGSSTRNTTGPIEEASGEIALLLRKRKSPPSINLIQSPGHLPSKRRRGCHLFPKAHTFRNLKLAARDMAHYFSRNHKSNTSGTSSNPSQLNLNTTERDDYRELVRSLSGKIGWTTTGSTATSPRRGNRRRTSRRGRDLEAVEGIELD